MKKTSSHYIILRVAGMMLFCLNASGQSDNAKVKFLDYFFENASVLNWEFQGDSVIRIALLADYERESLNRQTDHWYFNLEAEAGTHLKIVLSKMAADVYNGKLATNWWNHEKGISCYVSYDNSNWVPIKTKSRNNEILIDFVMQEKSVYIARIPPYTEKNLELLKKRIKNHPGVKIFNIGNTLENRPLEIIRVGNPNAEYSILLRARAHPWEPGGNWVIEGLIDAFLEGNSEQKWDKKFCYYIMPMANKDGVHRGMTRFNLAGKDLNRNWLEKPDSLLAPENHALDKYVSDLIGKGNKPVLAIDFHNDDYGNIHLTQPREDDNTYLKKMELFRQKLIEHTWFSNRLDLKKTIAGGGNLADGMYHRFEIDAFVFELNANYINKLDKAPEAHDWVNLGAKLNDVISSYLNESKTP